LFILKIFPLPGIKYGPRNGLLGLLGYVSAVITLVMFSLWCLLGKIVKYVKVAFQHPLRILPGEATVACFLGLVILVFRVKPESCVRNTRGPYPYRHFVKFLKVAAVT
jgi:hypothetical protein